MRLAIALTLILAALPQDPTPAQDLFGDPLPPGAVARMGTVRFRHDSLTMAMKFTKDGSRLVTAGYDHTVRIWDATTGKSLSVLMGHKDAVNTVSLTPAEDRILSWSRDGEVRLWTIKDGSSRVVVSAPSGTFTSVGVSPDGRTLACGTNEGKIRICAVDTGEMTREFDAHKGPVTAAVFSGDGKRLITAGDDGFVIAWNPESGQDLWRNQISSSPVKSLVLSPDNRSIAAAIEDKSIVIVEADKGIIGHKIEGLGGLVSDLSYSPDGRTLVGHVGSQLTLWDLDLRKPRWSVGTQSSGIHSTAFHPGGKILATGGSLITLHDTETGKRLDTRESHEEWIECLRYTPDGKRLLSSSRDGTVRIWDSATGRPIRRLEAATDWGAAAAVSPDGKRIVTCGRDDKMRLWDFESGRMEREFPFQANRRCGGLSFTADEQRLVFAGVDLMWIDVAAGKAVKSSRVLTDRRTVNTAMGLAVSADGKILATGHYDKTIRLWNAETLEESRVIAGHKGGPGVGGFSLAFAPDGRLLAAADQNEPVIRLWEVASGRQVALFEGHGNEVTSIAISPDGLWLASGSLDGTARLWELSTGKELFRFLDDKIWKWVGSVALSPDGRQLATGLNGTILTWTLRPPGPKIDRPIDDLWKDLGSPEADRAFRALWGFVDGGEKSIKALSDRIPLKVDAPERITKLIAALGSEDIEAREEAMRQLAASAGSAETIIIEALKGDIGAEAKARLERILSLLDQPLPQSPELLHRLRAIQALERLGAAEAIKTIEKQGPFQRLRREAAAALKRLEMK